MLGVKVKYDDRIVSFVSRPNFFKDIIFVNPFFGDKIAS